VIVRFTPEQISEQWDVIKEAVATVFAKNIEDKDRASNIILQNLLSNIMQCWAVVVDNKVDAIIITAFMYTPIGTRSLMLYAIYIYNPIDDKEWISTYEDIKKYALANGCKNIVGYVSNPKLLAILKNIEHIREMFVTIPIGG
jgi:hypothetical protein